MSRIKQVDVLHSEGTYVVVVAGSHSGQTVDALVLIIMSAPAKLMQPEYQRGGGRGGRRR